MKALAALFGKSPFGPLQSHMQSALACVERLPPLFETVFSGDFQGQERLRDEISEHETRADAIKNDLRSHLPKSMFLPVARGDLLDLLAIQDRIADRSQDIALAVTLRALKAPAGLKETVCALVGDVGSKCLRAGEVIQELDELVETGFSGAEAEKVLGWIEGLDADEIVAEGSGVAAGRKVLALEAELGAVDTLRWLGIIRQLAELANLSEALGNRLRLLLAK